MTAVRAFRFEIDWLPLTPTNEWHGGHWRVAHGLARDWRAAGYRCGQMRQLSPMSAFTLDVQARYQDRPRTDADAFAPAAKAIVDGLVDWGIVPDDKPPYFQGTGLWPPTVDPSLRPALIVIVTQLEGDLTCRVL